MHHAPRAALALLIPTLALTNACASFGAAPSGPVVRGASGIGDPSYPEMGNGGYDALHYAVELAVDPATGAVEAAIDLRARALENLEAFNLDYRGPALSGLWVNGAEASIEQLGSELVVTPERVLPAGAEFELRATYSGVPEAIHDPAVPAFPIGWLRRDSGIYAVSEPSGTTSWMPCNDHPRDKATWSFALRVPSDWMAAANGLLVERKELGEETLYRFEASDPMATYLATVCFARFDVHTDVGPGGLPITHYVQAGTPADELEVFDQTAPMLAHFSELFGPYPFESFGSVVMANELGAALETQTLAVYGGIPDEGTLAHEMAHQWFGDSVSPANWRDIWLNEGFAAYATWLWVEHREGVLARDQRLERTYSFARRLGAPGDPALDELFGPAVYLRGALTLHALRLSMGDETFFRLLRDWHSLYAGSHASTEDFIALAVELGGEEVEPLLRSWLFEDEVPELVEG